MEFEKIYYPNCIHCILYNIVTVPTLPSSVMEVQYCRSAISIKLSPDFAGISLLISIGLIQHSKDSLRNMRKNYFFFLIKIIKYMNR